MKLHEYQAKNILKSMGVPVPESGGVATTPREARMAADLMGGRAILKAQVHAGGRGKAGGIRVVESPNEAERVAGEMLGMLLRTHQNPQGLRVNKLLVEKPVVIERELYAGIVPDRSRRANVLMLSAMGGMDIEAVAEEHPEAIVREVIDPTIELRPFQARRACYKTGLRGDLVQKTTRVLLGLYEAFMACDCSLLEVNPLAITDAGEVLAADAKMTVDDNALYRHPELEEWRDEASEDPIEAEALRRGIQYVRLDGTVGVMGNGAGLVMATLDEIARAGGKAANFLDVGGGARAEVVRSCLELVLMNPNVRCVLVNIYGGITRCDEVAKGILEATAGLGMKVPLVVRLAGTRAAEGLRLLEGGGHVPASTLQEAARLAVQEAAGG